MARRVAGFLRVLFGIAVFTTILWFGTAFVLSCESSTMEDSWEYEDQDHDGVRNGIDPDVDGDGYPNYMDALPYDPRYY